MSASNRSSSAASASGVSLTTSRFALATRNVRPVVAGGDRGSSGSSTQWQ